MKKRAEDMSHAEVLTRLNDAQEAIASAAANLARYGLRIVECDEPDFRPTHMEILDEATGKWSDVPQDFDFDVHVAANKSRLAKP